MPSVSRSPGPSNTLKLEQQQNQDKHETQHQEQALEQDDQEKPVAGVKAQHHDEDRYGERLGPLRVVTRPGVGRCLVAARAVLQGELLFREAGPLVVGPDGECGPGVCLACLAAIDTEDR